MKISNYEISKKLAEIGFKAKSDSLIHHPEKIFAEKYWAYDLETLIDALPVIIEKNKKNYFLFFSKDTIGYYPTLLELDYANIQLHDYIFELYIHHESLADTAGKMIIELFEAGIINFNK